MSRQAAASYEILHLREWRDSRYLSQAQLAKESGVSVATIKYLESRSAKNKHPASAATLSKLAKALGVSPQTLVAMPPQKETPTLVTSGRKRQRGNATPATTA